jgi:hypothetical protein
MVGTQHTIIWEQEVFARLIVDGGGRDGIQQSVLKNAG